VLASGYVLGAVVSVGFGWMLARHVGSAVPLVCAFLGAGALLGIEETVENALVADTTPAEIHGTTFGVLGTVNGIGDLVSSLVVGALWAVHPLWGFGYAACVMLLGAALVLRVR